MRTLDDQALKTLVADYIEFLRFNRNASEHTALAYAGDLSQFIDYVATSQKRARPTLTAADLTTDAIRMFLGELYRSGHSRATAARKLAAVRSFARYLRREGAIAGDPAALVGTPRREQKLPAHLSMDEMSMLLETPDRSSPLGRRDQAILELFYASGIRLSELVGLDLDAVNLSGRIVRVLGKGGKERQVPINTSAASAIRAYLPDREGLVHGTLALDRVDDDEEHPRWGAAAAGRGKARQARRASPACAPPCILCSSTIGGSGCHAAACTAWCAAMWPCAAPARASVRTRCGIRLRRTCWSAAPTYAVSRSCWAMRA